MLDVELNIRDVDGKAVVALCGQLDLAGTPGAGSHLIVAVAACGPNPDRALPPPASTTRVTFTVGTAAAASE